MADTEQAPHLCLDSEAPLISELAEIFCATLQKGAHRHHIHCNASLTRALHLHCTANLQGNHPCDMATNRTAPTLSYNYAFLPI